ncbi:MAG TPA: DUF6265 family protein [Vicinamibacterales bacterium]|nr:DUF6265 family protein [Vicinamibacterales bacterium]
MRITLALMTLLLAVGSPGAVLQAAPSAAPAQGSTPNTLTLPEGAPRPPARIADVAWLAGRWVGEGLGGRVEEVWSEPDGGAMVGYFRLVKENTPVFYEIMTLLEVDGGVEMRLKHVNPDMTGWEEKNAFVTFKLVKHDASGAYFTGLTFRKVGDRQVDVYLALRNADGSVREEKFVYRRVP